MKMKEMRGFVFNHPSWEALHKMMSERDVNNERKFRSMVESEIWKGLEPILTEIVQKAHASGVSTQHAFSTEQGKELWRLVEKLLGDSENTYEADRAAVIAQLEVATGFRVEEKT